MQISLIVLMLYTFSVDEGWLHDWISQLSLDHFQNNLFMPRFGKASSILKTTTSKNIKFYC